MSASSSVAGDWHRRVGWNFPVDTQVRIWLARAATRLEIARSDIDDGQRLKNLAVAAQYERNAQFVLVFHHDPEGDEDAAAL